MDFEFSQDEQLFRDTVREFAQKEIRPHTREMDETGQLPKGLVKKMADLGLLGITIPEKYGGAGGNFMQTCIAAEELARADLSIAIPVFYLVEASWAWVFARHGTEEAKQEILQRSLVESISLELRQLSLVEVVTSSAQPKQPSPPKAISTL